EKLWQTTGDGHCDSTPAYYDGVVYAGFDYDWTASPSGGCYALNASTGEEVWRTWMSSSVWGSVSVDEDYVYGTTYNFCGTGEMFVLYRNNGTEKEINDLLRTDSTPAVAYGNIYICGGCEGYSATGTFCVDKETLEVIWSAPAGSWTASPAVADGKVYVGGFCYDAFTGEEIFSYEQGGLSPVIANGCLFNVQNGRVVCFGGAIMMDIGDYVVLEDSSIVAPITIYGITDYGTTTMQLEYDSSIAWVTSVDGTPDSTVSSVNINNPAGIVTLSAWDTDGVSGDVAIANVTLEARGPGGSTTALDLTVITLKDTSYNEIPAYDGDGSFTVKESVPPVVGSPQSSPDVILNDNGRAMVPGTNLTTLSVSVTDNSVIASVTIDLTPIGGNAAAEMTPAGGTMWSVTVNATSGIDESHCLTVNATDMSGNSNTDVCIPLTVLRRGDVVRDNSVDIVDAYYIARHSVGLEDAP
ncbi:MAG: PQQ-binding-like beta-propeller repeat protein, partial [Methanosarcinales archaeon]|nr:PQQ-binding-like beta-propeller repeat protein [Methanosarcinales archaeon]